MESLRKGIHYLALPQERWAKNGYEGTERGILCGTTNVMPENSSGHTSNVTCPMCLFFMKTRAQLGLTVAQDKILEDAKASAFAILDGGV